jgi:hypothetical protein
MKAWLKHLMSSPTQAAVAPALSLESRWRFDHQSYGLWMGYRGGS